MKIRDVVIVGLMGAVLLAVQVAFAFLPNIELVSLLIILFTLVFGRKTFYIIYVFVALEGILYGIGLWWINYLYIWTILFVVTMLLKNFRSVLLWTVVCGMFGFSFGALCSIPYFLTGGFASGFAYWVTGIPFDMIHGVANALITLFLFQPLYYVLRKLESLPL